MSPPPCHVPLILDVPPMTAAEHIARDDEFMRAVGRGDLPPHLRLSTCTDECVILGRSQSPDENVDLEACRADGIPVLTRFSGGGTVFVTRGCLIYSVVFTPGAAVKAYDVQGAYRHVLSTAIDSLRRLTIPVEFYPPCDLAVGGRKIAGNAQAQKRGAILVHGSFLIDADIERIARYVREPIDAPAYRAGRRHAEFLCNLGEFASRKEIARALEEGWAPGAERAGYMPPALR